MNLLFAIIIMVVGSALLNPINDAVEEVTTATVTPTPYVDAMGATITPTPIAEYSGAVSSIASLLPLFFVIIIILYTFKAFAGNDEVHVARRENAKAQISRAIKNSKEFIFRIETESKKYQKFIQNLDELLGITSVSIEKPSKPLVLIADDVGDKKEYQLNISEEFDWYIADKHPDLYMFKVVGLHKKDNSKNSVYIIGKDKVDDPPYLMNVPVEYLETKFDVLSKTKWWVDNKLNEKVLI